MTDPSRPDPLPLELENLLLELGDEPRPHPPDVRIAACERALALFPPLLGAVDRLRRGLVENELGWCLCEVADGARAGDAPTRAIVAFRGAVADISPEVAHGVWLEAACQLGTLLCDARTGAASEHYEEAIPLLTSVVRAASPQNEPQLWARAHTNLGYCYLYRRDGDRADNVWRSTVSFQAALNVYNGVRFRTQRASTLMNLGAAYRASVRGRPSDNVEAAIRAYKESLGLFSREGEPLSWAQAASNLGNAYGDRILGERAENLEQAIVAFGHALPVFVEAREPLAFALAATNLGAAYLARLDGDPAENVERAIAMLEEALRLLGDSPSPARGRALLHRGDAFMRRLAGDRGENLERAIEDLQSAHDALTPDVAPTLWAGTLVRLGTAFGAREVGERAHNVQAGIDAVERALALFTRDAYPLEWARASAARAALLLERAGEDDTELAIAAYRGALQMMEAAGITVSILETAAALADALAARGRWPESMLPYRLALDAREELYRSSLSQAGRNAELAASRGLEHRAAYAFARGGDERFGAVILERNRARWINDALERDRTILEQLRTADPAAYESYCRTTARVRALQAVEARRTGSSSAIDAGIGSDRAWYDEMTAAKGDAERTAAAIAATDGFGAAFRFPTFDNIGDAVGVGCPLAYLAVTSLGGAALIVERAADETVSVATLPLDALTTGFLDAVTHGAPGDPAGGWLGALARPPAGRDGLKSAITRVTEALWEPLMRPLTERLIAGGATTARIVPCGTLSLLPLHASAGTGSPDAPAPCATDLLEITYALSARASLEARRKSIAAPRPVLVVADPQPVTAPPLADAAVEAEAVASMLAVGASGSNVLRGEDATRAVVIERLSAVRIAHFSCHAKSDIDAPLRSGVVLAHDELLTVADLFALELDGARLATLSACETATIGTTLPDEVVSLAVAFVRAGFAGVVASLWPVADRATALLMARFYERWQFTQCDVAPVGDERLTPAAALRDASLWLRDTTNGEKRAYFASFLPEVGDGARAGRMSHASASDFFQTLALEDPAERSHAHPYYWAAFAFVGE
ncbi:MAG: hypothetical protein NVS3B16_23800 [Vulcanimicrobiaceae bacterium]